MADQVKLYVLYKQMKIRYMKGDISTKFTLQKTGGQTRARNASEIAGCELNYHSLVVGGS